MLGVIMCFNILSSCRVQFMWGLTDFKVCRISITYFKHFFVPSQVLLH